MQSKMIRKEIKEIKHQNALKQFCGSLQPVYMFLLHDNCIPHTLYKPSKNIVCAALKLLTQTT